MFQFTRRCRSLCDAMLARDKLIVAALLTCFAAPALAEPLSFHDALARALRETPLLRASQAQTDSARYAAVPAGELPDPKLAIGVENLPIEGSDRYSLTDDFMTMQRIGLMQEFPNSAKREARVDTASARVALMQASEQITRQIVLRETAQAWLARQTIERQLLLLDELLKENQLFATAIRAQLSNGKGAAIDAVMPRQEAAVLATSHDELAAKLTQAKAQLRRWIGAAADDPLTGDAPDWPLTPELLLQRLHQHPELASFEPKHRVLDAEIAEASAATRPDWALEFAYQKRGPDFGDMVMLQVSVDLPFFASSRQQPLIAAKQAERVALDAERDTSLREHTAMLETEFADYQRLLQAEKRLHEQVLPLVEEKVALVLAAWRGGKGALVDVIAARRELLATRLSAIATQGERQQLAARLHYSYGDISKELEGAQP
jgi:outer membrane protein, heavy metal efflux system